MFVVFGAVGKTNFDFTSAAGWDIEASKDVAFTRMRFGQNNLNRRTESVAVRMQAEKKMGEGVGGEQTRSY
jgi:hypothetical protein